MVQFQNVSKIFSDGLAAVRNLNFIINEGEFVFLIGPSGSGKTTLIELLIRDIVPSEGRIYINDIDITRISRKKVYQLRRKIGVIFQDYKLIPDKTAYENVAFAMEAAGKTSKEIKDTVPYVLDIVGLAERMKAFPVQLSGGEKQRVAIARAIANNPKLLIADEPTGNLDPASAWDIVQILTKINNWGTTVIMSTHGTDIVNSLSKRVIQMEKGNIVRDDNKGGYEFYTKVDPDIAEGTNDVNDELPTSKKPRLKVKLKTGISISHIPEETIEEIEKKQKRKAMFSLGSLFRRNKKNISDAEITEEDDADLEINQADNDSKKTKNENAKKAKSFDNDSTKQSNNANSIIKQNLSLGLAGKISDDKNNEIDLEMNEIEMKSEQIKHPIKQDVHKSENQPSKAAKEKNSKIKNTTESNKLTEKKNFTEMIKKYKEKPIDILDLPLSVIKDLKSAGYWKIGQVIKDGPEKLSNNFVIDTDEVILVAKAISKLLSEK